MKLHVVLVAGWLAGFAGLIAGCGDDDYVETFPETDASVLDATVPAADAATDAGDAADADDAASPLAQCQSCILDDCGPTLVACLTDPTCRSIATCALTTNCLSDLPSCIPQCITPLGLEPGEVLQEILLLQQLATQCTTCFASCQDALPPGIVPDGGFPGLP